MDLASVLDIHFLLSMAVMFGIFLAFYFTASRRQKLTMEKVELSLKYQEQAIYQEGLMLNELRKMNRLLSELAGMEDEVPQNNAPGAGMSPGEQTAMRPPLSFEGNNLGGLYKLYVGNIDYTATETELANHFGRFGQVELVNIPVNRYTGRARGFGFVTFASRDEAERAMALNGSEFRGRQIQVNFAKERDGI